MRIVTNSKLIKRNSKIGQYSSIGALIILGIGLYISFAKPELFFYSLGALALGFILSQVGMYFGNRWGRSPRPDEVIDRGLKGLGREYTIYHYVTPAAHLLAGPAGVWVILPYHQSGTIVYEKNRWKSRGGGFLQSYLRLFGQENMGKPEMEARSEVDATTKYLGRILPEGMETPPVSSLLLFTSPKAELQVKEAPIPAITPKDLKDFLRNAANENPMNEETLAEIRRVMPKPDKEG
jgi:hypothetical protein